MTHTRDVLIVIPAYNEKDNITRLLDKIYSLKINLSVLIVDDNSPDGTAQEIYKSQGKYSNLHLISRRRKLGLGSAYREGFKYAIENRYNIVIQMDADLSHLPRYIPHMLNRLEDCDLVIGSRYIKTGGVYGWPLHRIWLSRSASIFSKKMLRIPINDLTSGFKCIKRHVLEGIDFNTILSKGYAFQIEMVYRIFLKKFNIVEYPIIFRERTKERSKMSLGIIIEAFLKVLSLTLKRYKLFLPIAGYLSFSKVFS